MLYQRNSQHTPPFTSYVNVTNRPSSWTHSSGLRISSCVGGAPRLRPFRQRPLRNRRHRPLGIRPSRKRPLRIRRSHPFRNRSPRHHPLRHLLLRHLHCPPAVVELQPVKLPACYNIHCLLIQCAWPAQE